MIMEAAEMALELIGGLGSVEGLKRTEREMAALCERLGSVPRSFGCGEIERLQRSLAALSEAICTLDRAVRERMHELSGEQANVG
jgi:hypothetical protein